MYAGVWIVFLLIPAMFVALSSDAGPVWDIAAYLAIVAFAVIYIGLFRRMIHSEMPSIIAGARPNLAVASVGTVLLGACIAVTLPSLGLNATTFMPFIIALWMWALPLRAAMLVGLGWWALTLAVIWLVTNSFDPSYWLGVSIALLFIMFFRFFNEHAVREEDLATELATVREREEISRDVHDLLGHSLTVIALKTQVARRTLRTDPDRAETELDELLALTSSSLDEVRGVVGRMRTPDLASQLAATREALHGAEIEVEITGKAAHVPADRRALFAWAIREATTNILRHAEASHVTILVRPERINVVDDGRGIDTEEGHGLTGLRRRVEDAGAALRVRPANAALARPGTELIVEYET